MRPGRRQGALILLALVLPFASLAGCSRIETFGGAGPDCTPYRSYGTFDDEQVTIATAIVDVQAQRFLEALRPFKECTGIDVVWKGTSLFEAQLERDIDAGRLPDLAAIQQPGLLPQLIARNVVKPASAAVTAAAHKNYPAQWLTYGTVGGKFYATPLGANLKSFVWYSPSTFQQNGWKVPGTWDEFLRLVARISATPGVKPLCAGFESGESTGWPATDWVEDVMLRTQGPAVYDAWARHEIPFDDPRVVAAIDEVGKLLRNPAYVNGGFGDVASMARVRYQDGGLPVVDSGECAMHRQGTFLADDWPHTVVIRPSGGDVFAFYLPSKSREARPVLVAGEFLVAFDDRPATQALHRYMSSPEFTNQRAAIGHWVSPNTGLDLDNVVQPIDRLSVRTLRDPRSVIRFDASDLMPAAVGSGSFWREMIAWITEGKSSRAVAEAIEASWPKG